MGDSPTWFPEWKYPPASRITELKRGACSLPWGTLDAFQYPSFLFIINPFQIVSQGNSSPNSTQQGAVSSSVQENPGHIHFPYIKHLGSFVFIQGISSKKPRKRRKIWFLRGGTHSAQIPQLGAVPGTLLCPWSGATEMCSVFPSQVKCECGIPNHFRLHCSAAMSNGSCSMKCLTDSTNV